MAIILAIFATVGIVGYWYIFNSHLNTTKIEIGKDSDNQTKEIKNESDIPNYDKYVFEELLLKEGKTEEEKKFIDDVVKFRKIKDTYFIRQTNEVREMLHKERQRPEYKESLYDKSKWEKVKNIYGYELSYPKDLITPEPMNLYYQVNPMRNKYNAFSMQYVFRFQNKKDEDKFSREDIPHIRIIVIDESYKHDYHQEMEKRTLEEFAHDWFKDLESDCARLNSNNSPCKIIKNIEYDNDNNLYTYSDKGFGTADGFSNYMGAFYIHHHIITEIKGDIIHITYTEDELMNEIMKTFKIID